MIFPNSEDAMKKIRLAGLLLLPVTLLTGCGGITPALSLSANWYSDNTLSENRTDEKEEVLKYKVTYQPEGTESDFTVSYDEGTYTTSLRSERRTLLDGTDETVYVYTTELNITGRYAYGSDTSEDFTDCIKSEAVFRNVSKGLQPLSSSKTVKTTSPTKLTPSALEGSYHCYEFTYVTEYDNALEQATVTYTDLTVETPTPVVTELALDEEEGTYFDNEQLLFALRGVNLSSVITFRSLNQVALQVQSLATSEPTSTSVELKGASLDGTVDDYTVDAVKINLAYQATHSGGTQSMWYAKTGTPNTWRNVLLYMEVPIMYSMGSLCYTLTSAEFTDK